MLLHAVDAVHAAAVRGRGLVLWAAVGRVVVRVCSEGAQEQDAGGPIASRVDVADAAAAGQQALQVPEELCRGYVLPRGGMQDLRPAFREEPSPPTPCHPDSLGMGVPRAIQVVP